MKLTRKILASVIALVMVLLMLPAAMAAEENVYVLDVSADLEAMAADAANAGKEIVVNDYFTVILGEKTKIDSSKKTFDDGYQATQRLNFQHKTKADGNGVILPAVKFTTSAAATIKLWWVEGGDDNRQFAILNEAGEEVTRTNETLAKNDKCISELTLEAAGTYYLGTPDGSNYLFKMEVTEAAAEVEPPVEKSYTAFLQYMNANQTIGNYGLCSFTVTGPDTYTVSWDMYEGYDADSIMWLYIEIDDAFADFTAAGYTVEDVQLFIDGNELAVNQDFVWTYASTVEGQTNDFIIELYNVMGFSGPLYNYGCPIDVTNFALKDNVTVTFTLTDPNAPKPCEHTNTKVEGAKDATCTEAGFTGNTVCADCGEQIAAGEEIAVLEHTYADGACTACGAADPDYVPGESKTITIGDKTFTAAAGKWTYNTAITAADAAKYGMIIFDKGFEGSFETNGWGAAIVLDGEGKLVKIYDGANGGFHTVDGKSTDPLTFTTANYAVVAFSELQDGEMLIIFPNDGVNAPDSARSFALGLRNGYCGQTATVTGFTFDEEPEGPSETVDLIGIAVAMMAASGTALVCLKKKED